MFAFVSAGRALSPEAEQFYAACHPSSGKASLIRELAAKGIDVNQPLYNEEPAIVWACRYGAVDCVVALLECGAAITAVDAAGKSLLEIAILIGQRELTQLLVRKGAKDSAEGLLYAGAYGRAWAVEMLAAFGAFPNATNSFGQTPLMLAAYSAQDEVLPILLKKGADSRARDQYGCTALMYAVDGGNTKSIQALLNAGSDVNATNTCGESAIMRAARCGKPDVVRMIAAAGADVHAKDIFGNTSLMKGIYSRNISVVNVLLELGCDINARGVGGMTPLLYAIVMAKSDIIESLIKKGADINARTERGDTALSLAEAFTPNSKTIDILRKAGGAPAR